jgi:hypothetical protein
MRLIKLSKSLFFLLIILPLIAGIGVGIFFFAETDFSLAKISWYRHFERDLQEKGEIKLGELVSFEWDKIYLIESYDTLGTEREAELFPQQNLFDPFWWRYNNRYWTIAYQRPAKPPFLIRIAIGEWYLRNMTNGLTTDPNAKLRRVPQNTIESTYCSSRLRPDRCLGLIDSRSSIPTIPRH